MFAPVCGYSFRPSLYQNGKWKINTVAQVSKVKKFLSNILWLRLI